MAVQPHLNKGQVVTLSTLDVPGFVLARPLTLLVEQDEGGMFLASDAVTTVYGYGDTDAEAVTDYMVSLVEYYELLEASDSKSVFLPRNNRLYKII